MQRSFRPLSNVDGYPVDPKSDKDVPTALEVNTADPKSRVSD